MSLVLAVQPDADQGARLTSVCRRIGVEIVLAPYAPEALAALGDRVPDVIVTTPLLPADDGAAIAERLRALGGEALHVQMLSAPILGEPVAEPPRRGLLKSFRRSRRTAAPAVCDPLVFAGELSGHLLRAVAERAALTGEPIVAPSIDEILMPRAFNLRPPETIAAPTEVELTPLLDWMKEGTQPRKRKSQGGRRRRRRVYEDAAYFDPARCEFAALVDKFDEFVQQEMRAA